MKTLNSSDVMPNDAPHRFDENECSKQELGAFPYG
jgi:hypothetical protein